MKLPNFLTFEPFNQLRNKMNAELPENLNLSVSIDTLTIADLEVLSNKGIDISLDEIIVLKDNTLAYKDRRVLVYIRDIADYGRDIRDLPRFHISNCKTLVEMRMKNRFERYVISIRTDGQFELNFIRHSQAISQTKQLKVCWNCLSNISWKEFNKNPTKRVFIRNTFLIEEYFSKFPLSHLLTKPKYSNANSPLNNYPENWAEISEKKRRQNNYKCEKCFFDLSHPRYRKYLHVHHVNGQKNDSSSSNLKALCIECHSSEDMHSHIKRLPDLKEFLLIKKERILS